MNILMCDIHKHVCNVTALLRMFKTTVTEPASNIEALFQNATFGFFDMQRIAKTCINKQVDEIQDTDLAATN